MNIKDLKDLKKLIALCRLTGVEAIEVDGVKMNLGPTPTIIKQTKLGQGLLNGLKESIPTYSPGGNLPDTPILTDELTDEQRVFWSSDGTPDQQ